MSNGKKFRVLLSVKHPHSETLKKVLGSEFEVAEESLTQSQLMEEMKKDYDAIIESFWIPITGDMIRFASPKVKAIATLSVGFDHIDLNAAEERGIKILNAAIDNICASAYTVAEHAFGLLLSVARKIGWCSNAVREGIPPWDELARGTEPGVLGKEFFGRTLCIIGVGRIGSHIARIGRGFGMKVIGYDPYVDKEMALESGAEIVDNLEEALSRSDFIAISPCLTDETKKMIGASAIGSMRDGVYIVNTARGAIVDENAVIQGLRSGKIGGYAADVLVGEPPSEETSLLLAAYRHGEPNLLLTPHIAWVTDRATERYAMIIANKIRGVLTGKPFPHPSDYLKIQT